MQSSLLSGDSSNDIRRVLFAGRARSLDEVAARIGAITLDELNAYCEGRAAGALSIASIGTTALEPRERMVPGGEPARA